jgi:hypothetical protein
MKENTQARNFSDCGAEFAIPNSDGKDGWIVESPS